MPTVTSFLQLFRMLCVYYPTKVAIRNANVDQEERIQLLTSFKECMSDRFKKNQKSVDDFKARLKDSLLKGICYASFDCQEMEADSRTNHIVYYLCGYTLHSCRKIINCDECTETLETAEGDLPSEFFGDALVSSKSLGFLKFASVRMFQAFSLIDKEISKHFESEVAFLGDSFSDVITRISELTLPELCCDEHRDNLMVTLIYNYVVMRFRLEAKHKRETELREGKTLRHKNRKLGKLANRKGKK